MFKHLKQVNMTYCQHLKTSFGYSYTFLSGSFKAFVHGILPNCYETSTSDLIKKLHNDLKQHDNNIKNKSKFE